MKKHETALKIIRLASAEFLDRIAKRMDVTNKSNVIQKITRVNVSGICCRSMSEGFSVFFFISNNASLIPFRFRSSGGIYFTISII